MKVTVLSCPACFGPHHRWNGWLTLLLLNSFLSSSCQPAFLGVSASPHIWLMQKNRQSLRRLHPHGATWLYLLLHWLHHDGDSLDSPHNLPYSAEVTVWSRTVHICSIFTLLITLLKDWNLHFTRATEFFSVYRFYLMLAVLINSRSVLYNTQPR